MPKQTETLSVFLRTQSDKKDFPYSAAEIGLPLLQLGSLLSRPGNVLVHFCPPCNPLLVLLLLKTQCCLVRHKTEQVPTAPEVRQQQQTIQSAVTPCLIPTGK